MTDGDPHLSIHTAGFGTLQMQVAGLHRAGPSATLDKAYVVNESIIDTIGCLSRDFSKIIHNSFMDISGGVRYNRNTIHGRDLFEKSSEKL